MARLSDINVVFRKEMLYILRDPRTLLLTALIPIVFMPFLLLGPELMAHKTMRDVENTRGSVSLSPDNEFLRKKLSVHPNLVISQATDDPLKALRAGDIDTWLEVPTDFDGKVGKLLAKDQQPVINVRYDGRQLNSFLSETKVVDALLEIRGEIKKQRLATLGIPEPNELLHVNWKTVALNKQNEALGLIPLGVPPILLFMILVALMYPSLDLITGERERGTMSLLVVARADHADIMLGKMLAVSAVGETSILLGLTSLFLSVNTYVAHGAGHLGALTAIAPFSMFALAILAIPVVLLCTCLAFLLAGMCKTFQQGQGYFLPFLSIVMMPAGICSFQGIHLNSAAVMLPVSNLMLAMRDILANNFEPLWLVIAWIIGCCYAVLVGRFTVKLLDREALVNEGTTPAIVRRRKGDYLLEAVLLLSVCFLLMFYPGQIAQAQDALSGVFLSQLLCILAPALACLALLQLPFKKTLSLTLPRLKYVVAALLLAPAVVATSMGISAVQSFFLPVPESYAKAFLNVVIQPGRPFWLIVAVFALLPAVCEELLFRGAIQGLLRKRFSPIILAVFVGLAFGLFHMSTFRFLPTATMGMVLSTLTILSGSIFPSMILHGLHNTILIALEYFKVHELSNEQLIACVASGVVGVSILVSDRWKK